MGPEKRAPITLLALALALAVPALAAGQGVGEAAAPAPGDAPGDARVQVRASPILAEVVIDRPGRDGAPLRSTYLFPLAAGASDLWLFLRAGQHHLRVSLGDVPPGRPPVLPRSEWAPMLDVTLPGVSPDEVVDVRLGTATEQRPGRPGSRSVELPAATIRGPLAHETVRRHILRHRQRIARLCATGRAEVVSVTFVVSPRGAVTASAAVRSTSGDPVLDWEVARAVQSIPFPRMGGRGVTVVTYPFAVVGRGY